MFSEIDIRKIVKEQLALECNCSPNDFDKKENILVTPGFSEKRRKFSDKPFFFKMLTMGENAVISADERLHDWLREFINDKAGHWLFEHTKLRVIDRYLESFGKQLFETHHMFLPDGEAKPKNADVPLKCFEREELRPFYEGKQFPNALCEEFDSERPDMLAIAAFDGDKIIAMAGCSADTPLLWQIGIDVKAEYRGKGIGAFLVSKLRDEVFTRGKIPYYGTSLSNIYSQRIALSCAFFPAWIEVETKE